MSPSGSKTDEVSERIVRFMILFGAVLQLRENLKMSARWLSDLDPWRSYHYRPDDYSSILRVPSFRSCIAVEGEFKNVCPVIFRLRSLTVVSLTSWWLEFQFASSILPDLRITITSVIMLFKRSSELSQVANCEVRRRYR